MIKEGKFKQVHFSIEREGHGCYLIEAYYRGRIIKVHTNDSTAYDYLDDDNKSLRMDALRHCYYKIKFEYERLYN